MKSFLIVVAGVFFLPLHVLAANVDIHTRTLAASCAACHGHEGISRGEIPSLAGKSAIKFVGKMKQYRDMPDDGSVMNQHAKGLTWEEITSLADYFASLTPATIQRDLDIAPEIKP